MTIRDLSDSNDSGSGNHIESSATSNVVHESHGASKSILKHSKAGVDSNQVIRESSNVSFHRNRFSGDNGSRINASEMVQHNLDYRYYDQMQRNSTLLDSQNEIPLLNLIPI